MATTKAPRADIRRRFVSAQGEHIATPEANTKVTGLAFLFGPTGREEPLHTLTVDLAKFGNRVSELAAYGLRSLLNNAVTQTETLDEAYQAAKEKLAEILEGNYSERGGERGVNVNQFSQILAKLAGKTVEEAKAIISAKETALANTDKQTIRDRAGEEVTTDAYDRWVNAIRSRADYKAVASELFPRQRKNSPKSGAPLEDLL